MYTRYFSFHLLSWVCCALLMTGGCNRSLEIDAPITSVSAANIYTSDDQAAGVLTGIYARISGNPTGFASGTESVALYTGLSGDELQAFTASGPSYNLFYTNAQTMDLTGTWSELFQLIYTCNAAIEGISSSTRLTPLVQRQLLGEAKFMRGFLHFYLVGLWGEVPIVTTTDYRINQSVSRRPVTAVYEQIITDMTDAQALLSDDYHTPTGAGTTERLRPNRACAAAMLARVYLYSEQWSKAEASATAVINNAEYGLVTPVDSIFFKTSREAIWQLPPVTTGINTFDGKMFIRTVAPSPAEPVALSSSLVQAFAEGDQRKEHWIGAVQLAGTTYYFPKKYQVKGGSVTTPVNEFLMVLRLAEIYLIRAEARARQGNLLEENSAAADLDLIRARAGLNTTTAQTQSEMLAAIEQERRTELFTEWGHRWFDLKRTGRLDAVMNEEAILKGISWNPDRQVFPIPVAELDANPHLRPQNPGYN